jgi:hypothetical protein
LDPVFPGRQRDADGGVSIDLASHGVLGPLPNHDRIPPEKAIAALSRILAVLLDGAAILSDRGGLRMSARGKLEALRHHLHSDRISASWPIFPFKSD